MKDILLRKGGSITVIEGDHGSTYYYLYSSYAEQAIQTHHYLNMEDRIKATDNCYKLLKDNGIYVTFENIRPGNDEVLDFQLDRWMNFQLSKGRSKKSVSEHRKRFGVKYFPIKVSEHLELLNSVGLRIVEIFWLSYLQAGFFCIK